MPEMMKKYVLFTFCIFFLALSSSCASRPVPRKFAVKEKNFERPADDGFSYGTREKAPLTENEKRVLASAEMLMGKPPDSRVVVNGRTFTLDCIGTVGAIYYRLSLDITRDFPVISGNGVKRLHESLRRQAVIYNDRYPRPGDIVFWDYTTGTHPLSHAGVVVAVDPDGTIHYVHSHVRRGVVVEAMNLLRPAEYQDERGKVINNAMALGSGITRRKNPARWLSGDLWNSFGNVLQKRDYYQAARAPEDLLPSASALAFEELK